MVLFWAGVLVALVAAARSTYSPCGLSMLSTITPFGERGRGHRYGATAAWYLLGAIAGGATLGGLSAGLAALVKAAGSTGPWTYAVAAALAAAGALTDGGLLGPVLPLIRRQVDDRWLARYRPWVYGVGFGWQIGVGLATYLMTAAVGLVVAFGILSGSPLVAFALGLVFGLARGSTGFLTARASRPADLRTLHGRLDAIAPAVRRAATGLQAGLALGLLAAAVTGYGSSLDVAVVAGLGLTGGAVAVGGLRRLRPSGPRPQVVR
jgi:MFS family permease